MTTMKRQWGLVVLMSVFLLSAIPVLAETVTDPPNLAVQIGDNVIQFETIKPCTDDTSKYCINWLGQYIKAIFQYGVGLAAVLAVIMIMIAGFLWLTSGGSSDRVSRAKQIIGSSLLGLVLALLSFTLLYTINPRLIALEPIRVTKINETYLTSQKAGCCVVASTKSCMYADAASCAVANGSFSGYGSSCATISECEQVACHGAMTFEGSKNAGGSADGNNGIIIDLDGETQTITLPEDQGLACGDGGHCWGTECVVCEEVFPGSTFTESDAACHDACRPTLSSPGKVYVAWTYGCCLCAF